MRYYDIRITDESGNLLRHYSSHDAYGNYNPGSLMVEFDLPRYGESSPAGEARLTVWGIGPKEMQQARQNLFGKKIRISAGMSRGLPLAGRWDNKKLAIEGTVFQVFGNWQGVDLRLDFIIVSGPVENTLRDGLAPVGLTLPWQRGQKLSVALNDCFRTLGSYTYNISISDRLVLDYERQMFCGSLSTLAQDLRRFSRSRIKDPGYSGVEIAIVNGREIRVWDNDYGHHPDQASVNSASARSKNPVLIDFYELIGQPTWIQYGIMSLVSVMRTDIQTGDHIVMRGDMTPLIQAASYSQYRDDSAFRGEFEVRSVRLIGNSRQPTADAWITIIEAYPVIQKAG